MTTVTGVGPIGGVAGSAAFLVTIMPGSMGCASLDAGEASAPGPIAG